MTDRDLAYYGNLIRELVAVGAEQEWLEFKENNTDPTMIGQYISALSNGAVLNGQPHGYVIWGIRDGSREIVGTEFHPALAKGAGNEPLENWLLRALEPKIHFRFIEVPMGPDQHCVILEISRAFRHPVRFQGNGYVRVGEVRKLLRDAPERERALWRALDDTPFESRVALGDQTPEQVAALLDGAAYFELLGLPQPASTGAMAIALAGDGLVCESGAGSWDITNLGAILLARRLGDFPGLGRKSVRVIQYRGLGRTETLREWEHSQGYAVSYPRVLEQLDQLLPTNEFVGQALRRTVRMFPEIAVREVIANAIIHQDFQVTGAGPMVEIFDDRIEITNPGMPLVDTRRFLDNPPKSRNEALAALMRRFGICEERGSGIDKVITAVEFYQLPAPLFEQVGDFTRATLFSHKPLNKMDRADRIRACYLHACLRYVMKEHLTNTSLRERLGIEPRNKSVVSRIIREAVAENLIQPHDPTAGSKSMKYVPYWA